MKIIIAPDKFKGSLTSFEVCQAIANGINQVDSSSQLLLYPMADGGDGFAAVMKHYLRTDTVECLAVDPLGRELLASYEWNAKTKTAIVEMAVASGLILLKKDEQNPLKTSSLGTGLLIRHAFEKGAQKIILGLGGSATNDAGTGILSALGFQLRDAANKGLAPTGENLFKIEKIIPPQPIPKITFEIACDVQNKLYGPQGAAYVYARQKGANDNEIKLLDDGLKSFAAILAEQTGKEIADVRGAGAAGGIAAGLMGFFDVQLKRGIELVIEASAIENEIKDADLVITGEGKIDEQTLAGKVVSELSRLASQSRVPVAAFCGIAQLDDSTLKKLGVQFIETLVSPSITEEQAIANAKGMLTRKANEFFGVIAKNNLH